MSNFYPSPEQQEQIKESAEERRCDLCKYEDLTCPDKGCNSVNNLKDFEPKGSETEDTGCTQCGHWRAVKVGKFCPDCGKKI